MRNTDTYVSRFIITIQANNAAFHDDHDSEEAPFLEAARILRELADRLAHINEYAGMWDDIPLKDNNGNRVGSCRFFE